MVLNFPGPYELRLSYSVASEPHEMRHSINVDGSPTPGTTFDAITGTAPDLTSIALDDYVEAWLTELGGVYNNANALFTVVELWKYNPLSFDANFVSAYTPTASPSAAGPSLVLQQATFTWRTLEGGIFKQVLLESAVSGNEVTPYPTANSAYNDLFDFFVNPNISLAVGRDTSRPFAPLRLSVGQNEALFRKRHRN